MTNKKEQYQESTIGIEYEVVEVSEHEKSKPWKRAADPQFIAFEKYANDVIAKETERQYMKVRRTQKKLLVVVLEIVREEGEKNEKDLGNPMEETNLDYCT